MQELSTWEEKFRTAETELRHNDDVLVGLENNLRDMVDGSAAALKDHIAVKEKIRKDLSCERRKPLEKKCEISMLESLVSDLRLRIARLDELENIASTLSGKESATRDNLLEIQTLYDRAQRELELHQKSAKSTETQLRGRIAELEQKLLASCNDANILKSTIKDLEDRLQQTHRDLTTVQKNSDATKSQLVVSVSDLEEKLRENQSSAALFQSTIKDLESKLQESKREIESQMNSSETTEKQLRDIISELEEKRRDDQRCITTQQTTLQDLQEKLQQSKLELERHCRTSSESEKKLRDCISDLEDRLQNGETNSKALMKTIDQQEAQLRKSREETTQCADELQKEIAHLEYELQMANELLGKERAAMDAKVEEFEKIKVHSWNLRQKASRVDKLEKNVADLQAVLVRAQSDNAEHSHALRGKSDVADAAAKAIKRLEQELDDERRASEELKSELITIKSELEIKT